MVPMTFSIIRSAAVSSNSPQARSASVCSGVSPAILDTISRRSATEWRKKPPNRLFSTGIRLALFFAGWLGPSSNRLSQLFDLFGPKQNRWLFFPWINGFNGFTNALEWR
jgi:hypothetical protein